MKKLVAVLLALSLVLTMAFAVAEEESTVSTYVMVAAADAEGYVVDIESANLPALVMAIDSASDKCAFGTEEASQDGTYEIVTGDDGVTMLNLTLADGSTYTMFYTTEEDMFMLVDDESGVSMFLYNLATLADEVAAE